MSDLELGPLLTRALPPLAVMCAGVCRRPRRTDLELGIAVVLLVAMVATSLGLPWLGGRDLAIGAMLAVAMAAVAVPVGRWRDRRAERREGAGGEPGGSTVEP